MYAVKAEASADVGHGTFVAGVIAGGGTCPGLAPDAEVYAMKVFTSQQACDGTSAWEPYGMGV